MSILLKNLKKIDKEKDFMFGMFILGWILIFISAMMELYIATMLSATLIIIVNNRYNMWNLIYREEYIKQNTHTYEHDKIVTCINKNNKRYNK